MSSIYNSTLWTQDLDQVIETLPFLDQLSGKTIMITGAGGLICSALADILLRYEQIHRSGLKVIAAGRNREKLLSRFAPYVNGDSFQICQYDALQSGNVFPERCDYIIHGAGNAYPGLITREPVETMRSNFDGLLDLLFYARDHAVTRTVYISSGEIYGQKETPDPYRENEYGYVDLLSPRNSYSIGKRAAETLCASFTAEYKTDTVIVRPCHTYGPTASVSDNRVSSAWAYAGARGEAIVMKSAGRQIRSYCHCLDASAAILTVMLKGVSGEAYNIANPDSTVSIRQLAELVADIAGIELKNQLPTESEAEGFNPMDNAVLDSTKLRSLGWRGSFDTRRGISHTITVLRDILF